MLRKDIDDKYKWDLKFIYKDYDEWNKDYKKLDKMIDKLIDYKGHLLDSAKNLLNFYQDSNKVEEIIEKLNFYTFLKMDVNINDEESKKYNSLIYSMISKYNSSMSFVTPEILKSDYSLISKYMDEEDGLKEYKRLFELIFRAKEHILSDNEEAIISEYKLNARGYEESSTYIRNKEIDFGTIKLDNKEEVKLTASNKSKYSQSESQEVRRQVFENENKGYERSINSLASNYIGFIKNYETSAKYHKFNNYLENKLYDDELDIKVYDTFKEMVLKNNKLYSKYIDLVQNALKLKEFHVYDMSSPLVKNSNKEYKIEDAKNIILDTFSLYGDKYLSYLKKAFDLKCIDFLPSDDKITSWYSAYIPCLHPVVFANYNNKILDISSLCHELGHFVNQAMIIDSQPPQYVYQSSFCAEVASLNNEIVFSHIFRDKETDKNVKLELLANYIKIFAGNFFGAARQAIFEEKAHEAVVLNKPLSSEVLSDMWLETTKEVYSDKLKGYSKYTWAQIPHFYMRGGYYTFNYSTAIIASSCLASKILNNEEGIIDKFYQFLRVGNSMDPIESLKILGIDMTSKEPYEIALNMFDKAMDEFNKLNK